MSLHLSKPLVTHLAEPGPRQPTFQVKPALAAYEGIAEHDKIS